MTPGRSPHQLRNRGRVVEQELRAARVVVDRRAAGVDAQDAVQRRQDVLWAVRLETGALAACVAARSVDLAAFDAQDLALEAVAQQHQPLAGRAVGSAAAQQQDPRRAAVIGTERGRGDCLDHPAGDGDALHDARADAHGTAQAARIRPRGSDVRYAPESSAKADTV